MIGGGLDYEAMWKALKVAWRNDLEGAQARCLSAAGENIHEVARNFLLAQGMWLASQALGELISQIEKQASEGELGEDDAGTD